MPFWTAIAAHFFIPSEKLSLAKVVGLFSGHQWCDHCIVKINATPASEQAYIGDIYCLVAAMCWSGIVIVARTTRFSKAGPEMQLLYQLSVSAIVLLLLMPLFGDPIRVLDATILTLFTIQVLVVVCFGFFNLVLGSFNLPWRLLWLPSVFYHPYWVLFLAG